MKQSGLLVTLGLIVGLAIVGLPSRASAHCDTMDGPTVQDGKAALEKGDITPALKWIGPNAEPELKQVFDHVMAVRTTNAQARELADKYFFETLVRLHRAGEGAPYEGLKPEGTEVASGILAADEALETGALAPLLKSLTEDIQAGVQKRFEKVRDLAKHKDHSVDAGRAYVEAYVTFVHYVEGLADLTESAETHAEEPAQKTEHHH